MPIVLLQFVETIDLKPSLNPDFTLTLNCSSQSQTLTISLDSFPRLCVRQSDATSRRSSFGADSDMDFGSSRSFDDENIRKDFRFGSSELELYGDGDDGDELGMRGIDSSELIGNKRSEESVPISLPFSSVFLCQQNVEDEFQRTNANNAFPFFN